MRPLPASHPQSWDNPANEDFFLELARAIGRQIARDERDGLRPAIEADDEQDRKGRRDLRAVQFRYAKGDVD
jgi:hypothetical protein